jgi:flavodoxin short chain
MLLNKIYFKIYKEDFKMNKIAIIYWSGTGNTQQMAEAINEGVTSAGAESILIDVSSCSIDTLTPYDKLMFGCPSMGAEVLEESEFEPFFSEIENSLSGKKVALFGSYGWGDGEWMRNWEQRTEDSGANLFSEGLIINEAPDSDGEDDCKKYGADFVKY